MNPQHLPIALFCPQGIGGKWGPFNAVALEGANGGRSFN